MKLKALLFDMDGTLSDSDPVHMLAWQEILHIYGIEINDEIYHARIVGRVNPQIVRDFLPQLPEETIEPIVAEKEAAFRRRAGKLEPLPGLMTLLEWRVNQGLQTALVTNATHHTVPFSLQALGLDDYFKVRVLADEVPAGKPDPRHYEEALRRLKIAASEAVVFEDSPSGVRSAAGAGIATVGITTTQPSELLKAAGATLTVPDFTAQELWDFLEQFKIAVV
ncbi:MAG: HAD family hydrolase [Trueperaceae bacterium]